jgi:hypothetical protein
MTLELSWHRVGLGPNPPACVSGDVGRAGFAVLWHSPFESAKRLPNRGVGCQPARTALRAHELGAKSNASSIVLPLRVIVAQLGPS